MTIYVDFWSRLPSYYDTYILGFKLNPPIKNEPKRYK